MSNRLLIVFFLILVGWLSHVGAGEKRVITVSAAMSLKNAFEEMIAPFEKKCHPIAVNLNFGASGDLTRQIKAGAPVDVFASASQRDMDALEKENLLQENTRIDFAGNEIVLIQPKKAVPNMASFADLAEVEIQRIALGNPKSVPAGAYGAECLEYLNLYKAIKPKLIFCEHVRQVLDYTARGEVDAGLVYATDGQTRPKEVRIVAHAPAESHGPIVYPIAIVKDSPVPIPAKQFIDYMMSDEGQEILARHGFQRIGSGD